MESVFAKIAKYLRTKETDRGERKIFIQAGVHPHIGGVRHRAGKRLEISLYCGAVRRGGFCADLSAVFAGTGTSCGGYGICGGKSQPEKRGPLLWGAGAKGE